MVLLYFVVAFPGLIFIKRFPAQTRSYLNFLVAMVSVSMLKVLGMKVKTNMDKEVFTENYLIASNHLSYLDILALSSLFPSAYVASVEVKNTPFLGQITTLAGCVFVERRSRSNLGEEIKEIDEALKIGSNVTIFPEATSTNGEQVLKFKRPLFEAAITSKRKILPLTINYNSIDSEPVTAANRDLVCWYGDMEFASHLFKLCATKHSEVEVIASEPITIDELEIDSAVLRDMVYESVLKNFSPVKAKSEATV